MRNPWVKFGLLLILVLIVTTAIFRHRLCRLLISSLVTKATGLELSIEELNLNLVNSSLNMRGLTLFNPPGFKDKILARAEEISIGYDLLGSLKGRLHLPQVKIDISEVNIIRNKQGQSNVAAFRKKPPQPKPSTQETPPASPGQTSKGRKGRAQVKFLIDRLELSLAKAAFADYRTVFGEPTITVVTAKEPFVFKNISDLSYVVSSVSIKGGFGSQFENVLQILPATEFLKSTTEAIKQKFEDALQKVKNGAN